MYHYQSAYWPQTNPYFSAFRRTARPASRPHSPDSVVQPGNTTRTDGQIAQDVRDELDMEPSVRGAAVGVQVSNAVLTLSGVADSEGERSTIESAARRIAGVGEVVVQLTVLAPDVTTADDDIAHDCERVLRRLTPTEDYTVGVMVSKGWVTLSGNVAEGHERRTAETEVGSLPGVSGVNSQVKVRSSIARDDAIMNNASYSPGRQVLESGSYGFSADNDRMTWSATKLSWAHHRATLLAAWSASRAKRAIDRIRSR